MMVSVDSTITDSRLRIKAAELAGFVTALETGRPGKKWRDRAVEIADEVIHELDLIRYDE